MYFIFYGVLTDCNPHLILACQTNNIRVGTKVHQCPGSEITLEPVSCSRTAHNGAESSHNGGV